MSTVNSVQNKDLEKAFVAFSQASEQLVSSYQVLEARVADLTGELAEARSSREQELQQKERLADRLQTLLTALPAGVVLLDGNGVVQECNPAALDLLGEPLIGEVWVDIIERSFAPRVDDGQEVSLKDGRLVSISASSLDSEPGMILLLKDVTDHRRMQEKLDRSKRLSAMGEMAASLAHQIRTPLSSALLYTAHLSKSDINNHDRQRFAGKALSRLRDLEKMVNDMLLFVRGKKMICEEILIDDLLDDVEHVLESKLSENNSEFNIIHKIPGIILHGNRQALVGAILNLASNAMEVGGKGTRLSLETSFLASNVIEIKLTDNGPGLSEEEQEQVFEPFFTKRTGGTGLGLAVVQAVANAHQGDAWVVSEEGKGATFGLNLPVRIENHNMFSGMGSQAAGL
ncbi:MAG: ATP-binding protein [Gammaproteobacteria bacterium]|nr:ATP-binding protein [Gammaproteobacteria bacterium]MDH5593774.1 ATP-binding protein [Gammaproteobacteria bacterium]MDH5613707.1 ATP-binding protein [Gammaproteobacteria bacterium]